MEEKLIVLMNLSPPKKRVKQKIFKWIWFIPFIWNEILYGADWLSLAKKLFIIRTTVKSHEAELCKNVN